MLINIKQVNLAFGSAPLLESASFIIPEKQRIALIGRNGVGKSSLLRLLAKELAPDSGQVDYAGDVIVSYLTQEVPMIDDTIFNVVARALSDREEWQVTAAVANVLALCGCTDLPERFNDLSGGYKRRILLAAALINEPDVLLLDEPTNHLDITTIQWLENLLLQFKGTVVFISHDRQFVSNLAQTIYHLDRGQLTVWACNYPLFLQRFDEYLQAEAKAVARQNQKLSEEEVWLRQGVKARRKRNQGRLQNLIALRKDCAERRQAIGKADLTLQTAQQSGRLVIEADQLQIVLDDQVLVKKFSTRIMRGDRIGILGPNGCGKTTLIKCLLKQMAPTHGTVTLGTQLQIAYFDQLRQQLDLSKSVFDNVAEGQSHIDYLGNRMHVVGYLQQFLFMPDRVMVKASMLSGGEKNRLLLAKLFSVPANFLVMDEPTNDLDLETLELLEEVLANFAGTLLLVSHDRTFLNNVVTSTIAFEGNGEVYEYVGGYDDYLTQRRMAPTTSAAVNVTVTTEKTSPASHNKLSLIEQKELRRLPAVIDKIEQAIAALRTELADPNLYQPAGATRLSALKADLAKQETELEQILTRWEALEARSHW